MMILVSTLSSTVTIHVRPYTVPLNGIPTLVISTVGEGTVYRDIIIIILLQYRKFRVVDESEKNE